MTMTHQWKLVATLSATLIIHQPVKADELWPSQQLALKIENRTSDDYIALAKKARRKGKIDTAQVYAEQALQKSPESIKVLEILALLAKSEGDYQTAADYYDDLLEYHPDYVIAYIGLAECYKLLGNTSAEVATLESYQLKSQ